MYAAGPRELHDHGIEADTFEALAEIAIQNAGRGLGMVCGPITTGGTGHQILNLEIFNATVHGLQSREKRLFNQIPFEFGLRRLTRKWEAEGNTGYCMPILEVFYARVFERGVVTEGWFIPGWDSSFGARWERDKLVALSCAIHDLTHADIRGFLLAEHSPEHVDSVMGLLTKK